MIAPDRIVTVPEIVELFGLASSTLSNWKCAGLVTPIRTEPVRGGRPRQFYRASDIQQVIDGPRSFASIRIPEGHMTLEEAAGILGLVTGTIRTHILRGNLRGTNVPYGERSKWFVVREDVERMAGRHESKPQVSEEYAPSVTTGNHRVAMHSRREKLRRDGIRVNFDKLLDEWKRTG